MPPLRTPPPPRAPPCATPARTVRGPRTGGCARASRPSADHGQAGARVSRDTAQSAKPRIGPTGIRPFVGGTPRWGAVFRLRAGTVRSPVRAASALVAGACAQPPGRLTRRTSPERANGRKRHQTPALLGFSDPRRPRSVSDDKPPPPAAGRSGRTPSPAAARTTGRRSGSAGVEDPSTTGRRNGHAMTGPGGPLG
jgi:hypothetical protein